MMFYCPACGNRLEKYDRCSKCGTKTSPEIFYSEKRISGYYLKRWMCKNGIDTKHCGVCYCVSTPSNNLTVHHFNGDYLDNQLENLRIHCEKCHNKIHNNMPKKKPEKTFPSLGKMVLAEKEYSINIRCKR